MELTTPEQKLRLTDLYASLTVQWARQTAAYSRSVRLYNERLGGRRRRPDDARRRETRDTLSARPRSARLAIVGRENGTGASPAPPPAASPAGAEHLRARAKKRCPLTARQREIADLIAQGLTNGQIAAKIVVSRGTVGNHIGHMLRRLGVNNRAQIAAWAIRHASEMSAEDARGGQLRSRVTEAIRPAVSAGGEALMPGHDLDGAGVRRRDDLGDEPPLLPVV